jgi:hypothetical protein
MAQPSSRQGLIDYAKRQLGYPVLEINVADEQLEDLLDDAVQVFQERHYDGIARMYLKYKITQADIDRGRARGANSTAGITTTTTTATIDGSSVSFALEENNNYIQIPASVIGINNIFRIRSDTVYDGLFNIRYQLFLNDLYQFSSVDLLQYSMVQTYLEDITFLLNPEIRYRFNIRQDKLYIDVDWSQVTVGDYFILDCFRILDPNDFTRVYNDPFLKRYFTALCKKQWGMNLIKFQGVQLPGGVQLNGRQIYEDGVRELAEIEAKMPSTYEMPPLDMIG